MSGDRGSRELAGPLQALRRRLLVRRAGAGIALGGGLASLAWALWGAGGGDRGGALAVAACAVLAGAGSWLWPERRGGSGPALADLARHLDRRRPELEESALLLLASEAELTPLARLQRDRAAAAVARLPRSGVLPWRRPLAAVLAGGASLALAFALARSAASSGVRPVLPPAASTAGAPALAVGVRALTVAVEPPAYTGRARRTGADLDVRAEAGATVRWRLFADGPVEQARLLFADGEVALARGADGAFTGERRATTSELYALRLEAAGREVWRSPSARLEVMPDRPPALAIAEPAPLTEVPADHPGALLVRGTASDDYGLGGVELLVTLVAGGGEQISVRETRLPLAVERGGVFARRLDLAELGVQKDTELYLKVEAVDRRAPQPNRTRSETLRVRAAGPLALAAAGLDAGLRLQPVLEYFRSQRQIILDTEKLVSDAPRIARAEFEQRSQSLAFDQRALRLRYGALLGEEFESGAAVEAGAEDVEHIAPATGEGAPSEDPAHAEEAPKQTLGTSRQPSPKLIDLVPQGLVHQHDAQDEATFFTSTQRTQLKAVLGEMWGAEGALRVFDLKHALPYEYRALKLLKDLQQSARVYVPKIGYEPPELDLARRFKGELDGIHDLSARGAGAKPLAQAELRRVLDSLRESAPAQASDVAVALRVLSQAAVAGDRDALRAVDVLRATETPGAATLTDADRDLLRRALWRALPAPTASPRAAERSGLAAALPSPAPGPPGGGQP